MQTVNNPWEVIYKFFLRYNFEITKQGNKVATTMTSLVKRAAEELRVQLPQMPPQYLGK